jgi:hypothetical protein
MKEAHFLCIQLQKIARDIYQGELEDFDFMTTSNFTNPTQDEERVL